MAEAACSAKRAAAQQHCLALCPACVSACMLSLHTPLASSIAQALSQLQSHQAADRRLMMECCARAASSRPPSIHHIGGVCSVPAD